MHYVPPELLLVGICFRIKLNPIGVRLVFFVLLWLGIFPVFGACIPSCLSCFVAVSVFRSVWISLLELFEINALRFWIISKWFLGLLIENLEDRNIILIK